MRVPELDVLIASTLWLFRRGVKPLRISIAKGSEAGKYEDRRRLEASLEREGITRGAWTLAADGPDLIAAGNSECWQVECKGAGSGVQSTQRNNFDRALASVVSCYGNLPSFLTSQCGGTPVIALAIPPTSDYKRELHRRVSDSLRRVLNMWVLLCDGAGSVEAIGPEHSLPE